MAGSGDNVPAPAAELPPLLSEQGLKDVLKDVGKKDKCPDAIERIRAQLLAHPDPSDALFAAMIRVGTVLKTRHAEGSVAWRFGLRLFEDAVAEGRFNGRSAGDLKKLSEARDACSAAIDAADAAPEGGAGGRVDAPQAFEGQLSGELPTEFERQRQRGYAAGLSSELLMTLGLDMHAEGIPEELEELLRGMGGAPGGGSGGGGVGDGVGGGAATDINTDLDPAQLRQRVLEQFETWLRRTRPDSADAMMVTVRQALSGADVELDDADVDINNADVQAQTMERLAAEAGGGAGSAARFHRSASSASVQALGERTTKLSAEDVQTLSEKECPICRDDLQVGTKVVKMPCSKAHVFCRECVAEWLARDDSCPMCRVALPVWLGRPQYA